MFCCFSGWIVLGISKALYRVWHADLLYEFRLYGVTENCIISLSQLEFSKCVINPGILQNFLSDVLCFERPKKVK